MRTTVEIDDELWAKAEQAAEVSTKRALIELGLKELVKKAARRRAIALAGSMPDLQAPPRRRLPGGGDEG